MSLIAGKQISGSVASASYALTASYVAGGGAGFPYSGSAVITGSLLISGSGLVITGSIKASSITGSLFGTASYATTASYILNAVSSSYAATASLAPDYVLTSVTSSMLQLYVLNSSTASMLSPYVLTSSTSSMTVRSSSFAITASYAPLYVLNSSTSSFTLNSQTGSFVKNSQTSSFAVKTANTFTGTQTVGTSNTVQLTTSGQISSNIGGDVLTLYAGNITETNTLTVGAVSTVLLQSNATGTPTTVYLDNAQHVGINTQTPTTELDVLGTVKATSFSGSLIGSASWATNSVTASYATTSSYVLQAVSSSFASTASYIQNAQSASYILQSVSASFASTASYVANASSFPFTGSAIITGSLTVIGPTTITGSLLVTGSTTQVGTNNLYGNTSLSGSITISGSTIIPATPTIKIYGDTETNGVIKFMPVNKSIDSSISASYIYASGSTNDLYFTQNGGGYANTTRLRWIEGNMYTGLLSGGVISSTIGSTTFNVTSGSGIIVTLNAFTSSADPYPTIQYVTWPTYTAQPIQNSGSAKITYLSINSAGAVNQQIVPIGSTDVSQWDTQIELGVVLHLSGSVSTGVYNAPQVAYGFAQRTDDFLKAFGPLKVSGHTLQASGSTLGLIKTSGTAYNNGANYTVNPNHPSTVSDPAINTSKIYRYYVSGSTPVIDTGVANAGYTVIDPSLYNNNGVLTSVPTNGANLRYTIQRVFWIPNSPTNAFIVYYGNTLYASLVDANNGIGTEVFTEAPNTAQNAIFIGYVIVAGNATDLTVASKATIVQGGLFRSIDGIGSSNTSPIATTFASLSDVSVASRTNGDLPIYNGSQWANGKDLTGNYSVNGNLTVTGSIIGTASLATTASYVQNAQTASYVLNSISSSYALTASYVANASSFPFTGSAIITGSFKVIGSTVVTGSTTLSGSTTLIGPTIINGLPINTAGLNLANFYNFF